MIDGNMTFEVLTIDMIKNEPLKDNHAYFGMSPTH